MTNRFQQDLRAVTVGGQQDRVITSYRGLVKRLGIAREEPAIQFKIVQHWVDEGHEVNRSLFLSLEEAGIRFPETSGLVARGPQRTW